FYFHPQPDQKAVEKKKQAAPSGKIIVLESREISDPSLKNYLEKRKIPLAVASLFCKEILFELYGKKLLAIGFKNNSGGYELRSQNFKGSSTPKEPLLITGNDKKDLAVFEGFFSFLSFISFQQSENSKKIELPEVQTGFLILNSISFFEKSRELMERFDRIHLFLDRDKMGLKCTSDALTWSKKYVDQSHCYKGYKDLNDCLVDSFKMEEKQSTGKRKRL
ncbi:MAG: toprim domain-containing protein, partial [Bacteroidota bacterium]